MSDKKRHACKNKHCARVYGTMFVTKQCSGCGEYVCQRHCTGMYEAIRFCSKCRRSTTNQRHQP